VRAWKAGPPLANSRLHRAGAGIPRPATTASLPSATSTGFTVSAATPSATVSSLAVSPATITSSSGSSSTTITATVRDTFGNPVPGVVVTLAATGLGNSLTQ